MNDLEKRNHLLEIEVARLRKKINEYE